MAKPVGLCESFDGCKGNGLCNDPNGDYDSMLDTEYCEMYEDGVLIMRIEVVISVLLFLGAL
jgi:hypothetical protein